jgi:hypothetical protein
MERGGTANVEEASMNETLVRDILNRIDRLPEEDRLLLERRMSERAEAQWRGETIAAQKEAIRRGIDDAAIERAIEEIRYPVADVKP